MTGQGQILVKLNALPEDQVMNYLERTIRDVQSFFRTLTALDDFFKSTVEKEDRDRIKGIKPELASIKNSIVRANQIKHEYTARKEEEEQLKRMGINQDA